MFTNTTFALACVFATASGALAANPADAYVGTDPGLKIRFEVNRGWDRGH